MLDEIDRRALRIDDEPYRRAAAARPVLHRLEPFVLRRRRERRRQALARPQPRPAEIEPAAAIHRNHRRRRRVARRGPHVVDQTERRRFFPRIRGDRRAADVRVEHRDGDRRGEAAAARQPPHSGNREERHRDDERQRVSSGEGLLEQQVEREVRTERRREERERAAVAAPQPDGADRREHQHENRDRPRRPRRDERKVERVGDGARVVRRPQHRDVAEVFGALTGEHANIRRWSAARDDEGHEPHERARRERDCDGRRGG